MFLLLGKHQLRKGAKVRLPSGDAVLGRGQKDTFLYFLQVSRVGGGRKGEQWKHQDSGGEQEFTQLALLSFLG